MNLSSPQTKFLGLAAILSALGGALNLLFDGNPATNPDWATVGAAIASGWGLIIARQNNVSSEEAGAKPVISPLEPKV